MYITKFLSNFELLSDIKKVFELIEDTRYYKFAIQGAKKLMVVSVLTCGICKTFSLIVSKRMVC